MSAIDVVRLVLLAAIWGGAFLFIRIAAPELGIVPTVLYRVVLAGLVMSAYLYATRRRQDWRRHWRTYLATGTLNSAIPFCLFAYAAQTLPASYSVVMNATSPLFGILVGALVLGTRPRATQLAGVALGIAGVALIARLGPVAFDARVLAAVGACMLASAFYAIGAVFVQRFMRQPDSQVAATASQVAAAIVLAPLLPFNAPTAMPSATAAGSIVALAVLCSGVGYFLYFKLLERIGSARALTVTFLQPVFGVLWGVIFLAERVTPLMLAGGALVIAGTALAVRARGG